VLNVLARGRVFPGLHHRAYFHVVERGGAIRAHLSSVDGLVEVGVTVAPDAPFRATTLFATLDEASAFFAHAAAGYNATRDPLRLDGVHLATDHWELEATEVLEAESTFFEDPELFPTGSAYLDSVFLLRDVPVQWRALPSLHVMPRMLVSANVG
jgi:hypothetical protein